VGKPIRHNTDHQPTDTEALRGEFERLWAEAESIWDRHQDAPGFHSYVSSDYPSVFEALRQLRGRVLTVLEWGSGLGVVTIMASRMGFEAYGIEAELSLIEFAEGLAQRYGPAAKFAHGSFIPDAFEWDPVNGDDEGRTLIDLESAYPALEMELRDFDLVFAYPWPTEHALYRRILHQFGSHRALLLSYDAREGINLVRTRGNAGADEA
jgi:hypothetical protein